MRVKQITYRLIAVAAILAAAVGCREWNEDGVNPEDSTIPGFVQSDFAASCSIEQRNNPLAKSHISRRSLVNNTTTKALSSNFLRIDEDIDDNNNGLYTYTGHNNSASLAVNWNKAYLVRLWLRHRPTTPRITCDRYRSSRYSPTKSTSSMTIPPTSTIHEWLAGIRELAIYPAVTEWLPTLNSRITDSMPYDATTASKSMALSARLSAYISRD